MTVIEQIEDITDIPCQCCGFMTVYSSGFVVIEDDGLEEEYEYVARWTDPADPCLAGKSIIRWIVASAAAL